MINVYNIMETTVESFLEKEISRKLSNTDDMANSLLQICNSFYEKPVHSFGELKLRNTKVKGDIFEEFTKKYLLHVYKLQTVYLLKDTPQEILDKLNLKRKDYGIDLIGIDEHNRYYAIQAKFRKRQYKKIVVTWKQLSTFYSLCARTGPWHKLIVCTTADYISRQGKKNSKDYSINWNSINKIDHYDWVYMSLSKKDESQDPDEKLTSKTLTPKLTVEQLREARLKYLEKQN